MFIYKEKYKKPRLINLRVNRHKLERERVEKQAIIIIRYMDYWDKLILKNNLDEYKQYELIRAIYEHIKLEIAYNSSRKSSILSYILHYNFKIKEFTELIKNDINEIRRSTFGNIELINFLNQNISLNKTLLNNDVILSIILCTNIDLIRRANKETLETYKKPLTESLTEANQKVEKINDIKPKLNDIKKKKNVLETKKRICSSILALSVLGSTIGIGTHLYNEEKLKYKTDIHTFTSLGQEFNKKSSSIVPSPSLKTLDVYNEVYETDDKLYRTIETYDLSTTSMSNEEYYTLDLTDIPLIETKTVEVKRSDTLNSYKAVNYLTENEIKDGEMLAIDFLRFCLLNVSILGNPLLLGITYINKKKKLIFTLNKEYEDLKKELLNNKVKALFDLDDKVFHKTLKLCEEIIYLSKINNSSDEYQNIIRDYELIQKEYEKITSFLKEDLENYTKKLNKRRNTK